jgi:kumamolisin
VSDRYPVPLYQQPDFISPPIVPPSLKDAHRGRGIPDVAGNASRSSGYQLFLEGSDTDPGTGRPFVAECTSIVAPLYSGLAAVINENPPPFKLSRDISIPVLVGFLNPILYRFPLLCTDIDDSDKTINPGSPPDNGQGDLAGYPSSKGWGCVYGTGDHRRYETTKCPDHTGTHSAVAIRHRCETTRRRENSGARVTLHSGLKSTSYKASCEFPF